MQIKNSFPRIQRFVSNGMESAYKIVWLEGLRDKVIKRSPSKHTFVNILVYHRLLIF